MNIIKGGIYTQRGGIHDSINDKCNLVIIINVCLDYAEVDFVLHHQDVRKFITGTCFLMHRRFSIPTFSDVLKCGDTINPKYKRTLRDFLEGVAHGN